MFFLIFFVLLLIKKLKLERIHIVTKEKENNTYKYIVPDEKKSLT